MALHTQETLLHWAIVEQARNPHAIDLFAAKTEEEFIIAVEAGLNVAVDRLESRKKKQWATRSEAELRDDLLQALDGCGVDATGEEDTNGHVDFTVKHRYQGTFRYLGECKLWRSYSYHCKGMGQLLRRYASGRHARTCCLEFMVAAGMVGALKALRDELDARRPLNQGAAAADHPFIKGAFVTSHRHASDFDVEVLHLGCNVYVDPGAP